MSSLKKLNINFQQLAMIFALCFIILFFHIYSGGNVLDAQNLMNVISANTYVLIISCGMVMVIIAGHIDLSVGSIAAVVGIIVAKATTEWGINPVLGILLGLATGLLIGIWQGFWVAWWGIPAFIVTLAGMMIFRGLNQFIGKSLSVPVPDLYRYLGSGYLPDIPGFDAFNVPTMIIAIILAGGFTFFQVRNYRADLADGRPHSAPALIAKVVVVDAVILGVMWVFATGPKGTSFPVPGVILIILALFYTFLTQRTVLGRSVYAVGGNRAAAELTGVRVRWTNFFVICNTSFLAAIAAILFVGRATASGPADGNMWELDVIASVFIGGAAVSGGVGTVGATMVGGLVMAFLNNGLQLIGSGSDRTLMIKGLVLLAAVAIDVYSKKQGRRSIIGSFMKANEQNKKMKTEEATPVTADTETVVIKTEKA